MLSTHHCSSTMTCRPIWTTTFTRLAGWGGWHEDSLTWKNASYEFRLFDVSKWNLNCRMFFFLLLLVFSINIERSLLFLFEFKQNSNEGLEPTRWAVGLPQVHHWALTTHNPVSDLAEIVVWRSRLHIPINPCQCHSSWILHLSGLRQNQLFFTVFRSFVLWD